MSSIITVKTDEETKRKAKAVAKDMGLTMSSLINSYLKQVIATRRVELYAPEQMTPKLERLICQIEKDRESGQVSQAFEDVEEFLKDLKS
jgi:DNA-damage-inducible protein J